MERSTIFNGKTYYKWPFSIAMLNYQRVVFDVTFQRFQMCSMVVLGSLIMSQASKCHILGQRIVEAILIDTC